MDNQTINPNRVQRAAAKDSCRCIVKLIRNVVLNRCYTCHRPRYSTKKRGNTDLHTRPQVERNRYVHNYFPTGLSGSRLRENVSSARCKLSFDFLPTADQMSASLLRETLSKPKSRTSRLEKACFVRFLGRQRDETNIEASIASTVIQFTRSN